MPSWKKVVTSGSNAQLNHITASGGITTTGNSSFGNSLTDTHLLNGITTINNTLQVTGKTSLIGAVTASGNISSSKTLIGKNISISNVSLPDTNDNATHYFPLFADGEALETTNGITFNPSTDTLLLGGSSIYLTATGGHITASGNISSSGDVTAENLFLGYGEIIQYGTDSGDSARIAHSAGALSMYVDNNVHMRLNIGSSTTDVNATNQDHDFRHGANSSGYNIWSDAGLGKVGIKNAGPSSSLDVDGDLRVSSHITASGNISASGTAHTFGGQTTIGGILAANGTDSAHTFAGKIETPSVFTNQIGQLPASGPGITFANNITASGDISSSGAIIATGFIADDAIGLHFKGDNVRVNPDTTGDNLRIQGGGLKAEGNITASGDISASGNIILGNNKKLTFDNNLSGMYIDSPSANQFDISVGNTRKVTVTGASFLTSGVINTLGGDTSVSGHITASGKISASSTIEGTAFKAHDAGGYIFASGNRLKFNNSVIEADTDFKANGNITASGNISSSGTIISNDLHITGSGNLYGSSSYLNIVNDGTAPSELRLNCEANSHYIGIRGPVHSGASSYVLKLPNSAPSDNQILKVNGSPSGGEVTLAWEADATGGGGGGDVVDDTSPQLGGDLDLNSNDITGTGNVQIVGNISASGNANVSQITASAFQFAGSGTAELEVDGHITASGNISSSGTITAEHIVSSDDLAVTDQITAAGLELEGAAATTKLTINNTGISSIDTLISLEKSSATNWVLGADGGDNHFKINASSILSAAPDFKLDSSGNGSFTGNVSASGTMTMLTASIGGGIFTSASLAAGGGGGGSVSGDTFATDLRIGRDSDNHIDFTTDNQIDFDVDGETMFTLKNTSDSGSIAVSGSVKIQPQETIPAVSESRLYNRTTANGNVVDNLYFGTAAITPAYAWVTLDDDGTSAATETIFGVDSAVTSTAYNMTVVHDTSTNGTRIHPELDGVYKVTGNFNFDASSTSTMVIDIKVDGSDVHTYTAKAHSAVDPVERTIIYVGSISSGSYVTATVDGTANTQFDAGSVLLVERLS